MFRWMKASFTGIFLVALLTPAPLVALDVKPGLWEVNIEGATQAMKACFTREILDANLADMKMPAGIECTSEFKENSPKLVIAHSVCTGDFDVEGDSRIEVQNAGAMTMESTSVISYGEQQQTTTTNAKYKWLSSDCGDVKPIELQHKSD